MTLTPPESLPGTARPLVGWVVLLTAPLAWSLQLTVSYALAGWACMHGGMPALHAFSIVCIVTCLVATAFAWRGFRAADAREPERGERREAARQRAEFVGRLAVMVGALFTLVTAAQWVVTLCLRPCP